MSTVYSGNGTLVSPTTGAGVRKAISAVANTSPIAITCTGHGYNTGDTIEQEGTSGIADGQFQITKTSANAYTLNGTTANGTATTGYSIDYELLPATTIPANGELIDMGPLGAALEGSINPVPFLYRRQGKWRLYNQYNILAGNFISLPMNTNPWSTNTNFTSTTSVALASTNFTFESVSDLPLGPPPVFAAGDMLVVNASFTAQINNSMGGQAGVAEIGFGLYQGGSFISSYELGAVLIEAQSTVLSAVPVSVSAMSVIQNGSGLTLPTAALSFCIWARLDVAPASGSFNLNLIGRFTGQVMQYRAN